MLKNSRLRCQKGSAAIEMVPALVIVALLVSFVLGFFGVIHTGIIQSIASRNYAFETFRHRPNLTYLRDSGGDGTEKNYYRASGVRYHTTVNEGRLDGKFNLQFMPVERNIRFHQNNEEEGRSVVVHNQTLQTIAAGKRYQGQGVNPVWVKTIYGMCINSECGTD